MERKYYIKRRYGEFGFEKAIFDSNKKRISDWFDKIYASGLLEGKSRYFKAKKGNKEAIFDTKGNQISDWSDEIFSDGLINGTSKYYMIKKDDKYAIFDSNGKQISNWFDEIYPIGLLEGESQYFIARKGDKEAIFDAEGEQISVWFDDIYPKGLVKGTSKYYIAGNDYQNFQCAIFDVDGNQISDWFDWIVSYGILEGKSKYYFALKDFKIDGDLKKSLRYALFNAETNRAVWNKGNEGEIFFMYGLVLKRERYFEEAPILKKSLIYQKVISNNKEKEKISKRSLSYWLDQLEKHAKWFDVGFYWEKFANYMIKLLNQADSKKPRPRC